MISNLDWVMINSIFFYILISYFIVNFKWNKVGCRFIISNKWYHLLLIGLICFCVLDRTTGDYFHYREIIDEYRKTSNPENNLEYPYQVIIQLISANYFFFRLIVWGIAICIYSRILKLLDLNNDLSLSIFALICLLPFSCVRLSLGLVIFYLGFLLFYKYRRISYIKAILGILCILFSALFHKSLFVLLIMFPFTLIKLNKGTLILLCLSFPISIFLIERYIFDLLFVDFDIAGMNYLYKDKIEMGLAMKLYNMFLFVGLAFSIGMLIWNYILLPKYVIPDYYKRLLCFLLFVLYLSSIFLFIDIGDATLSARFRDMLYPALTLLLSHYFMNFRMRKTYVIILLLSFFFVDTFYLLYAYYLKSLGLGV